MRGREGRDRRGQREGREKRENKSGGKEEIGLWTEREKGKREGKERGEEKRGGNWGREGREYKWKRGENRYGVCLVQCSKSEF